MDNPLLTNHHQRVAETYRELATALLANVSRTGVGAEAAAEGVTYAFQQLAQRPDLTVRDDLTAWLTSVARNHATLLAMTPERVRPPVEERAPDLMAALAAHPAAKRRKKAAKAKATTRDTVA